MPSVSNFRPFLAERVHPADSPGTSCFIRGTRAGYAAGPAHAG
jgi:hypothetical protein